MGKPVKCNFSAAPLPKTAKSLAKARLFFLSLSG